jgi:signal transduction histidine kinase
VTEDVGLVAAPSGADRALRDAWSEFWRTPTAVRAFVLACCLAAVVAPVALRSLGQYDETRPAWLTAGVLILISILNVEIGRALSGGLSRTHQPHKALSAWAFSSALLLPTPWLLAVVPLSYAHARWRGLRLPLWKWISSAGFLVLAGVAAALVRNGILGDDPNLMAGNGGRGLVTMVVAALAFLTVESLLFFGPALLNRGEDEIWLRRTLTSLSFYGTEVGVLLIGGLLSAVWTGGAWFVLVFPPLYVLAQRAALHDPLREQAASAVELEVRNHDLVEANQFKVDLMGMLGHEIGNPLTSISGYAQLGSEALLTTGDTRTAQASLVVIERNAERIRVVLQDILATVSREGGALAANRETCLVEPHLRAAASAQPEGRRPAVECEPGLTALVQPGHLEQILTNLLSNADKYGGGAIRIVARSTPNGTVEICVADHGPGVPFAFQGNLFQRFSRHAETAAKVDGTGLGLFITRELARANGGDVEYRDGVPGSVFVVTLCGVEEPDAAAG